MKVCYMYEMDKMDNDYDKVKVEYALMKNPNLDERRSALGVLLFNFEFKMFQLRVAYLFQYMFDKTQVLIFSNK